VQYGAVGGRSGGGVFWAVVVPAVRGMHGPITMGYDRCPELLIDEKEAFMEDKLMRDVHLFLTHDPDTALLQLQRDARGRFGATHRVPRLAARPLGGEGGA